MILISAVFSFAETPKINTSDGVNSEEAVLIAKDYMQYFGLEKNYMLFWPSVTENLNNENSWHVSFPPTVTAFLTGILPFGMDIDKKTGEVVSSDEINN